MSPILKKPAAWLALSAALAALAALALPSRDAPKRQASYELNVVDASGASAQRFLAVADASAPAQLGKETLTSYVDSVSRGKDGVSVSTQGRIRSGALATVALERLRPDGSGASARVDFRHAAIESIERRQSAAGSIDLPSTRHRSFNGSVWLSVGKPVKIADIDGRSYYLTLRSISS